jgi:hypothetical protein
VLCAKLRAQHAALRDVDAAMGRAACAAQVQDALLRAEASGEGVEGKIYACV